MKNFVAAVLLTATLAAPAGFAQTTAAVDPAFAAAVRSLLETTNFEKTHRETMASLSLQLPEIIISSSSQAIRADGSMSAEERAEALAQVQQLAPEISAAVLSLLSEPKLMDELKAEMPALYARHFTLAEIREIERFYKTPAGAKVMQVTPQLTAESMQLVQRLVMPRMSAVLERIENRHNAADKTRK